MSPRWRRAALAGLIGADRDGEEAMALVADDGAIEDFWSPTQPRRTTFEDPVRRRRPATAQGRSRGHRRVDGEAADRLVGAARQALAGAERCCFGYMARAWVREAVIARLPWRRARDHRGPKAHDFRRNTPST